MDEMSKSEEVFNFEGNSELIEDLPVELIQNEVHITDKETEVYPELILQEIDGNLLNKNVLKVNAKGLENGLREKEDGIAYFGSNAKDELVS
jgi:hypothetical protein